MSKAKHRDDQHSQMAVATIPTPTFRTKRRDQAALNPCFDGTWVGKLTLAILLAATPAMASVTISQPTNDSTVTSPVQFSATSKTTTCAKGVASMGIYVDNKLIYVVHEDKLSVLLSFKAGKYETVVEEWDRCGGASYTKRNITVTEAGTLTPATMSTPAPGTVLAGSSVSFTWTVGNSVTEYELRLGTTGAGSSNLYNSGTTTATTEAVTGLPTTGATVTATLYSLINGTWRSNLYTYTEASPTSYSVALSWDAPAGSAEPVAGYKVYRSPSGSSTYQLLNSSVDIQTTYVDNTVQSGHSYDYIVESVDDAGVESAPTSPIAVSIP